jgi:hypothetical protein
MREPHRWPNNVARATLRSQEAAMKSTDVETADEVRLPPFMEHRWGKRTPCQARVRLCTGDDSSAAGRVRDISSSGAFIETALELGEGAPVTLLMLGNESAPRAVEVAAIVVRREPDGLAVEWCETPAGSVCAMVGCTQSCAALRGGLCDQLRAQDCLDAALVTDRTCETLQLARK